MIQKFVCICMIVNYRVYENLLDLCQKFCISVIWVGIFYVSPQFFYDHFLLNFEQEVLVQIFFLRENF